MISARYHLPAKIPEERYCEKAGVYWVRTLCGEMVRESEVSTLFHDCVKCKMAVARGDA